jgi:serine/threonine protein kinase
MFEWANSGNLRDLWRKTSSPDLTSSLVKDALKQILGLASALEAAHNLNRTQASYRHGDLKPENILVFKDNLDTVLGTLKIGDWGEAKYHGKDQATEVQFSKTTTRFGTRRYEAPEVVTGVAAQYLGQTTKRRSRLYDIWAMGCITLELTVWLLYGLDGLTTFNRDVDGETFYQVSIENGRKVARVHPAAVRWMEHIAQEPACQVSCTAIGDLLEIVRDNLLVVKLPRRLGTMTPGTGTERPRADSFLAPFFGQNDLHIITPAMHALNVSDQDTVTDLPTFSITPADPETQTELERIPVPQEPSTSGPERCLASAFRESIDQIVSEDDMMGYWDAHQDQLRMPIGLAGSTSSLASQTVDATLGAQEAVSCLSSPAHDRPLNYDTTG